MKRKYTENLNKWINSSDRKPLILRGARQVGKSTLVRLFAEDAHLELIEINLEKTKFKSLEKDSFKMADWIAEIEFICGKSFKKNTLVFLDEIQAQPKALSFLRYFYEERPEIAIISAGSLLEISLHQNEISFPVGRVSFLWISPMTFTEYLIAIGRENLAEKILDHNIPDFAHDLIKEEVKKYFFIGGMPRAVLTYIETSSLLEARKVQEEILQSFSNDFPKYEKRANFEKLQSLFEKIPFHLGKKLIYQHLDTEAKSADMKKSIQLFIRANIILPCYHVNASSLPLKAGIDHNVFKIYFLDIGLVNCMQQFSWNDFQEYFEQSFATKGFLAEQFIAQHLSYHTNPIGSPETFFWLKDKSSLKAEIDFIVSLNGKVTPLEVKAGKGGRLKSFEVFAREKSCLKGYKFSSEYFHNEKIKIAENSFFEVENWPYYAIEGFIKKLV